MGTQAASPFLVARDIRKAYGGAQALKGVSLAIAPGEVHGLVGANGAGKSTLIKIFAGLARPDAGLIEVGGRRVVLDTPQQATGLGMSFIHQELALVPGMTVLQNIMLGVPKRSRLGLVDWHAIARDVAPIARRVGITAPFNAKVKSLSTAENWLISICRALVREARLIVMDEPTASLSASESEKLFAIIHDLSASDVAVLYVSHRLDEILNLCHRVTVFRDGEVAAEFEKAEVSRRGLVEAIVGASAAAAPAPAVTPPGREVVLRIDRLERLPKVRGVSFDLHRGEVLGIGGLVGAGRSELARLIFGADRADGGSMMLSGAAFLPKSPAEAVRAGIGLVPEERRTEGLLLTKSVAFNVSLANLRRIIVSPAFPLIHPRRRRSLAEETIAALAIKAEGVETPVGRLSGGNQQKVVIGRWLQRAPKVLMLDEPTRGVDVGARGEIHRMIRALAQKGMAVLVISSEPDELPDLCDRVLVMAEGSVVRELTGSAVSRSAIVQASYQHGDAAMEGAPA